ASAQTGLNFQGVARTTNNVIIASQDITLKLSILQGTATGIPEYIEIRKVKTNAQGLFTAVIGDAETLITLGNFADIDWKLSPKFLKIEIDPFAGNNFISMGTTQFQYVAYAKFANGVNAENIAGIVPVARGGTGSNSLTTLKSNLALDKVNNTADTLKPISKLTQAALDLKLNIVDSTKAYVTPTQLASYNFSSGGASIDTTGLSNRINFKLNITDTALLLRKADTVSLSNRINFKLNITDTALLLRKADTASLSNRINLKLNVADTSTLSNRINLKLNTTDTASLLRKSQVGAFNGVASLDASKKIPSVQIPAISFSSVDVVNSMAAMLSFTSGTGLPTDRLIGSIVVRLDSSKNFVLAQLPASNRENWVELVNPDAPVKTVNGLYGYVDLRKANITDLTNVDNTSDETKPLSFAARTALDLKLNIADTSSLLKKADTSFLLQKVDTAAILAMYAKKFTKDVVVNYGGGSLGKYANGTTIPAKGKTLDDFLLDLVSKSVAPSFSSPSVSISASPAAGSYEIGYDPDVITLNSSYTKNDGGNATTTIFYKDGTALSANTNSPGPITTTVSYSVAVNYAAGTATKNDNLGTPYPNTITASSTSASLSFSSYSKRYWGGISSPFGSTADIRTLTSAPSSDNAGANQTFTGNLIPTGTQNVFFAYLATSPDLTSIIYNGLEQIDSYTKSIVTITNAQGYSQNYKVYTSKETYSSTLNGVSFR
ncbi:MAG: hypothetical protein EBS93_09140, partial [Chitinophagia bacterium]|nr:hypothetical protein [Chitinophagia bacterium]